MVDLPIDDKWLEPSILRPERRETGSNKENPRYGASPKKKSSMAPTLNVRNILIAQAIVVVSALILIRPEFALSPSTEDVTRPKLNISVIAAIAAASVAGTVVASAYKRT